MSAHYHPGLPITHISKGYMISKMASIHQGIQGMTGMFLNCESEGWQSECDANGVRALASTDRRHLDTLRFLLGNDRVNYGLLR